MNDEANDAGDSAARFPVKITLPVQWGEQDAFGHVNNCVYFRWFESARIAYLDRLACSCLNPPSSLGPILAAIGCNFRKQLRFPDTVVVGARITRLGRSSIEMAHAVWSQQVGLVADGSSTIVVFDYQGQRSHPLPDELRQAIARLEGDDAAEP